MSVKDNSCGIADLQDKMLDLLKHFIETCDKYGFHYWLAGGTCLGALRHQGFIPWDDDLDVYMPRNDYERYWAIMGHGIKDGHYKLCRTEEKKNYHHRVMQLVDLNTTFIHSRCKDENLEHGVYIDIIPIDACPDNPLSRLSQFCNAIVYSICNIQCKPEYNGGKLTGLMSLGTTLLLSIIRRPESRYKVWRRAERRMVNYDWNKCINVKCLTSTFRELSTPMPKSWFAERKVPFEDIEAVIPKNAEAYCFMMYGDFMTLPPKEKQTVRHKTEFIDLNNPYTKYKGIYYCIN